MADEETLIWFELRRLEREIEELNEVISKTLGIVNNNIESIRILGQILERQSSARIDWLN